MLENLLLLYQLYFWIFILINAILHLIGDEVREELNISNCRIINQSCVVSVNKFISGFKI